MPIPYDQQGEPGSAENGEDQAGAIDALQLIARDHRQVDMLLDEFERAKDSGDDEKKMQIAQQICTALAVHAQMEEELFYPALREAAEDDNDDDLLDEAEVEHMTLKQLIAQILNGSPDSPLYDAQVKVLGEYVQHHVKEEEREIFAAARSAGLDLDDLGEQMMQRKQELQEIGPEELFAQVQAAAQQPMAGGAAGSTAAPM